MDERPQRGHYNSDTRTGPIRGHKGGKLVAEALPSTSWHQDKAVMTKDDSIYSLKLL